MCQVNSIVDIASTKMWLMLNVLVTQSLAADSGHGVAKSNGMAVTFLDCITTQAKAQDLINPPASRLLHVV